MPRLLLFSDVHLDADACRELVTKSADADVVIGAGDFCVTRRNLAHSISVLSSITTPSALVCGNSETPEELRDAARDLWPAARVLHGDSIEIAGLTIFGCGGAVPVTPFGDWSYDLTEDEAARLLSPCPADCILVTHSPPKGAVDADSSGRSLGSTAIRDCILRKQPRLAVCGHIHGSWGKTATLGSTSVINPGPSGLLLNLKQ